MLKQIGSVFSFLTIIPTSNSDLNSIAKNMFLFPIVGIVSIPIILFISIMELIFIA